jgi:hypothetical protein
MILSLFNTHLDEQSFRKLFLELHDIYLHSSIGESFSLSRICRCADLDIKALLKLNVGYEYSMDNDLEVKVRMSLSTDCVCLRKTRSIFADTEHVYDVCTIPRAKLRDPDALVGLYGAFVSQLESKFKMFRICRICRHLYKDERVDADVDRCMHCMYDMVFAPCNESCVICNDEMIPEEQTFTLTCGHSFHAECILTHFVRHPTNRRECPLCRSIDTN